MQLRAWVLTDPGLKRQSNQDSYLVDPEHSLFIVADGMGGHKGGEVASAMAVESSQQIFKAYKNKQIPIKEIIRAAYTEASAAIFDHTKEHTDLTGMGTTMVLAHFDGITLFIGNVGDSRAYLIRDHLMWQLTEDHSVINEQIRAGKVKPEQASMIIARNVITRSVGFEREVMCDIIQREVQSGEIYLICSDGLHGMVDDKNIAKIVSENKGQDLAQSLIDEAKNNGGDDNVTTLILQVV